MKDSPTSSGRAGEYPSRFTWSTRSIGSADSFGQHAETFTSSGTLWGSIDDVTSGTFQFFESINGNQRATIRLRNFPGVNPQDRLTHLRFGDVWTVVSVRRGLNETLCEVVR